MWKEYFPRANIFAIDIFDKKPHKEERIKIFKGSQIDHNFLTDVCNEIGTIDIIVDDGSHINSHIIESFEILFPLLSQNGIYAIEDLQTSYWHSFGGDSFNLKNKKTAMNYFKQIIDSLNYEEIDNPSYTPNYYDKNIIGMSFYHNMLFIQKGINNEGSNLIQNNKMPTKNPLKSKFRYFRRRMKSYFSF